jgi:hypothetical protein
VFGKDKESVINVTKILQIFPKSFGNEAVVSESSEYDINLKDDMGNFCTFKPVTTTAAATTTTTNATATTTTTTTTNSTIATTTMSSSSSGQF